MIRKSKLHIKIKNFTFCFITLALTFYNLHYLCYAQAISSRELIQNAKQYDGKTIVYTGEAIGDVMARGNFFWINISDGQGVIGVWAKRELMVQISQTGGYQKQGDILTVKGIFRRSCPLHGGDLDIHAENLRRIKQGRVLTEVVDPRKKELAIALFIGLCLVLILRIYIKR
jgi:hypothetical protein